VSLYFTMKQTFVVDLCNYYWFIGVMHKKITQEKSLVLSEEVREKSVKMNFAK